MKETEQTTDEPDAGPVNYLPGMPPLSTDLGQFEAILKKAFRQRGGLRPVTREETETVVRTDGKSVVRTHDRSD